jgi:hypothetical protein
MAGDEYVEEIELCSVTKFLKKLAEKPAPLLIYVHYDVILDKDGDQAICHLKV